MEPLLALWLAVSLKFLSFGINWSLSSISELGYTLNRTRPLPPKSLHFANQVPSGPRPPRPAQGGGVRVGARGSL